MLRLLIANPLLVLFLVAGLGYWVGRIRLKGASLGSAAVLFVGLAFGALDPQMRLPDIVYQLGLLLFVYTIGLSSGADFVQSLRGSGARIMYFVALMIAFAAVVATVMSAVLGLPAALGAGAFSGSMTNTPALAGVLETVTARSPAGSHADALPIVGYSVAYPAGVLGMIIVLFACKRLFRITPDEEGRRLKAYRVQTESVRGRAIRVTRPDATGKTVVQLDREHDWEVVFGRIKRDGQVQLVGADTQFQLGDLVTVVGDSDQTARVAAFMGELAEEHPELERSTFDYRRMFVSNPEVVGRRLRDLPLRREFGAVVTRIRRGDLDLLPQADTVLHLGDRVRVIACHERMDEISRYFGDSYRSVSEIDVLTFSLGVTIGLLLGLIPIPLPGGGSFKLGVAGGPLIAALMLGALQRTGPIVWSIPYSANLTLRQLGTVLFLAGIGTRAGYAFADTLRQGNALPVLLAAVAITCSTALLTLLIAHFVFKMPFSLASGVLSGLQGQPAVLGFALEQERNDVPNIGYAAVFPIGMMAKILLAQVVLLALGAQ